MTKKQNRITQLREDVDRLRKSYTGAMTSANKAVSDGIEKLAEHELAAIKKHYEVALKNIKSLRKGGDPRDLATAQLRLLQETMDRIISNARESLKILEKTRDNISKDVRKELSGSSAKAKTKSPTKKPAAKKPAAKKKAPAQRSTTTKKTTSSSKAGVKKTSAKAPAKKTAAKKTTAKNSTAKKAAPKKAAAKQKASTSKTTAAAADTSNHS